MLLGMDAMLDLGVVLDVAAGLSCFENISTHAYRLERTASGHLVVDLHPQTVWHRAKPISTGDILQQTVLSVDTSATTTAKESAGSAAVSRPN
eukprot:7478115-Alexandrium_andersonii.AAC.1